ncbi:MAG: glycerate kinase [Pseudomonadota bacterium]
MTARRGLAPRTILTALFDRAVEVSHPDHCLAAHLPDPPETGRLFILAAGKAASVMAQAAETRYRSSAVWLSRRIEGLAVTRHGYAAPLERLRTIEAGHPVPDDASAKASAALLALANRAGAGDHVLMLLSGGGSALLSAPAAGLTLADKQGVTRALLRSGAPIDAINTVRRHLSRIKGGRLAAAVSPAPLLTLAISDVAGDDPSAIASGPTVGDPSTLSDARAVLSRFGITPSPAVTAALNDPANETPAPDDPVFQSSRYELVATPRLMVEAVAAKAKEMGFNPIILGSDLEGEARDLGTAHAGLAREHQASGRRVALISGGEAGVTVTGTGRGGPNQEYALALAIALDGAPGIHALAADTDGTDGGAGNADDPAGAFVGPDTLSRSAAGDQDPVAALRNNNSTGFFAGIGDLFTPGPTRTNVNDIRVILTGLS